MAIVIGLCVLLVVCVFPFWAAPRWTLAERKQAGKRTYYFLVDQRGNQKTIYTDSHICFYSVETGAMELELGRWLENLERKRTALLPEARRGK
jgi:hypothetical protein